MEEVGRRRVAFEETLFGCWFLNSNLLCDMRCDVLLVDILPAGPRRARESDLRQAARDGVWVQIGEPFARGSEVFV